MTNALKFYKQAPGFFTMVQRLPFLSKAMFLDKYFTNPIRISGDSKNMMFTNFSLGSGFMIIQDDDMNLYGIGDNRKGQCGSSDKLHNLVHEPTIIKIEDKEPLKAKSFAAGFQYGIALGGIYPIMNRR